MFGYAHCEVPVFEYDDEQGARTVPLTQLAPDITVVG